MTDFTPWTLFVDTGIISVLLLLGKLMRVKIRFIQRLFIPPSLLAGFIGLSLGPHGFGIIPLSTQTGTYAGILIAFIFGALPLISQKAAKGDADNIGSMWAYSQAGMLLQWAFGGLLGLLVLNRIWPLNLPSASLCQAAIAAGTVQQQPSDRLSASSDMTKF